MSSGIYLKCDKCGATLGGEQVTPKSVPPLNQWDRALLRELAKERGWHHEAPDFDLCSECESERIRNDPDLTLDGFPMNEKPQNTNKAESLQTYIERTYSEEMRQRLAKDLASPDFDGFITGTGVEPPKTGTMQFVQAAERVTP